MFQEKSCNKIITRIVFSIIFFFSENHAVYDISDKYGRARQGTAVDIIWLTRIAFWIPKATDTHSEYVIFIVGLLQQWLHERSSVLRYAYLVSLLFILVINQLDAQNLFYNKFISCLYMFRALCAHR